MRVIRHIQDLSVYRGRSKGAPFGEIHFGMQITLDSRYRIKERFSEVKGIIILLQEV